MPTHALMNTSHPQACSLADGNCHLRETLNHGWSLGIGLWPDANKTVTRQGKSIERMTLHFVITTLVYLLIVWPARPILLCCFVTLRTINLSITKQERGMGLAGQTNLLHVHDLLLPSVTWTTSSFSFCPLWCTSRSLHHSPRWQTPTEGQCEGTGCETPPHTFLPSPRPLAPCQHDWSLSGWSCSSVEVCLHLCWSVSVYSHECVLDKTSW